MERLIREEVALRTAELEREKLALRAISVDIVEALVNALEAKDMYLRGHSQRVAHLAAAIAQDLELDEDPSRRFDSPGACTTWGRSARVRLCFTNPGR